MLPHARLPAEGHHLAAIDAAASRLYPALASLDEASLSISDYQRRYLRTSLLANVPRTLQKYAYLLAWSLADVTRPLADAVVVDYGGGSGLLAVLAKATGVGAVVYVDNFAVSCQDAATIASALGHPADHYVHGELDALAASLGAHDLACDAIASNNVVEHIYDVEGFLARLGALSDGALTAVMSTAATPFNPIVRRRFMREQRQAEWVDRPAAWGDKASDDHRAFREVRAEIIAAHAPTLTPAEVDRLAAATRGQIAADIVRTVDAYRATGIVPEGLRHPTNTCDPRTGNWTEHLMDFDRLAAVLRGEGYRTSLLAGYYAEPRGRIKGAAARALNLAIRWSGRAGLRLAPFVTLVGTRRAVRWS